MKKHLNFVESPNPGKKTKRWLIYNTSGEGLGWIQFHTGWREYVWTMKDSNTVFSAGCTQEVLDFLIQHAEDRNG